MVPLASGIAEGDKADFIKMARMLDWAERVHHHRLDNPPTAAEGGWLATDDSMLAENAVSHAAHSALGSSLDHLVGVRALIRAGFLPVYAPFSLTRAALENACLALWLLGPSDRHTRIGNRCSLELDDASDSAQAQMIGGIPVTRTVESVRARLLEVTTAAGIDVSSTLEAPRRGGWGQKVNAAATHAGLRPAEVDFTWRWLSGYTHARRWAPAAMGEHVTLATNDGVATLEVTASIPRLSRAVVIAGTIAQRAAAYEQSGREGLRFHDLR